MVYVFDVELVDVCMWWFDVIWGGDFVEDDCGLLVECGEYGFYGLQCEVVVCDDVV